MSDGVSLLQNGSRESSRHRKGMSAKAQLEGIGRPLGDTFSFKDIFYHRWAETIHSSPLSPIPPMCVDWTASGASTGGWTALPRAQRDGRLVAPPQRVGYELSQVVGAVGATRGREFSRRIVSERASSASR